MESFLEVSSAIKRALELTAAEVHGFPSWVLLLLVESGQTVKGKGRYCEVLLINKHSSLIITHYILSN